MHVDSEFGVSWGIMFACIMYCLYYGVYGVPETYVIDKVGVIRFKQIGPITEEVLKTKINPLIIELNRS